MPLAHGQMAIGPERIESIDAKLVKFHSVGVGTIAAVEPPTVRGTAQITIKVTQNLRNAEDRQVVLQVSNPLKQLLAWSRGEDRILFLDAKPQTMSSSQMKPPAQLIDLDNPDLLESDESFNVYRDGDKLLSYIQGAMTHEPELPPFSTTNLSPPRGKQGDLWAKSYKKFAQLEVSNDDHLETVARQLLRSRDSGEREQGARVLRFRKSDENIRLMKGLLNDTGTRVVNDPATHLGIEKDVYNARSAAYETLEIWQVPVSQPQLERTVSRLNSIKKLYLWQNNLSDKDFELLGKTSKLEELSITSTPLSLAERKWIFQTKSLRSLTLPPDSIDDTTLPMAKNLPWLTNLNIDKNPITDKGADFLMTLPRLKSVKLSETEVTAAEFKKIRRERPDLLVTPRSPVSPIFLYIHKGDLEGVKRILDLFPNAIEQDSADYRSGSSPLNEAAYWSRFDIAQLLIERGADPESTNNLRETALFDAIHESQPDGRILELLLSNGASPAATDYQKFSVLDEAMYTWRSTQAIRLLVAAGAPTNPAHWPARIDGSYAALANERERQKTIAPNLLPQTDAVCSNSIFTLLPNDSLAKDWSSESRGRLTGTLQWSKTPSGRSYIGPLGQQSVHLKLGKLPAHKNIHIEIELFLIGSWDGNGGLGAGPDLIDISIPNIGTLMHSTFFNNNEGYRKGLPMQSFPDEYPFATHPAHTGASEFNSLGFQENWAGKTYQRDAVYRLSYTIADSGKDFELVITGNNVDQGVANLTDDENWGIASLAVKTD